MAVAESDTEVKSDDEVVEEFNRTGDDARVPDDEKTIEQLAAEGGVEEEESGQLSIAGTVAGLTLNAGGRKPDHSTAKVRALKLPVMGQFVKGEKLRFIIDVEVDDIAFRDEKEKGRVYRTRREHTFTPVAITAIPITD